MQFQYVFSLQLRKENYANKKRKIKMLDIRQKDWIDANFDICNAEGC